MDQQSVVPGSAPSSPLGPVTCSNTQTVILTSHKLLTHRVTFEIVQDI